MQRREWRVLVRFAGQKCQDVSDVFRLIASTPPLPQRILPTAGNGRGSSRKSIRDLVLTTCNPKFSAQRLIVLPSRKATADVALSTRSHWLTTRGSRLSRSKTMIAPMGPVTITRTPNFQVHPS